MGAFRVVKRGRFSRPRFGLLTEWYIAAARASVRPLTRAGLFSYRSTGPGIGAAAWAAQDAQAGEPGATCGHEADTDFEQDEQPPGEVDFEQVEQCRQPARPARRRKITRPNMRLRNI